MFLFHHLFLLFLIVFVHFVNFRVFITVSSSVFISPLIFTIVFWVFLFHQLSLPWLFFCQVLRFYVVPWVLRIWESFFTLRRFLLYTPSPHLPQHCECYRFERAFFTFMHFLPYTPFRYLAQPAFIKAYLGAREKQLSAEALYNLPNKLKNNHLKSILHESFYRICSKNILSRSHLFLTCISRIKKSNLINWKSSPALVLNMHFS